MSERNRVLVIIATVGAAIAGCGDQVDVTEAFDRTWYYTPLLGAAEGHPGEGDCELNDVAEILLLRLGSDGILSVLRRDDWHYWCGDDIVDLWQDYTTFCKTLNYELGEPDEDGAYPLILQRDDFDLEDGVVTDEVQAYRFEYFPNGSMGEPVEISGINSTWRMGEGESFAWDAYDCVPEDFATTDFNDYAPDLGTGQAPQ